MIEKYFGNIYIGDMMHDWQNTFLIVLKNYLNLIEL